MGIKTLQNQLRGRLQRDSNGDLRNTPRAIATNFCDTRLSVNQKGNQKGCYAPTFTIRSALTLASIALFAEFFVPFEALAAGAPSGPPPPFGEFLSHIFVYWFNFLLFCGVLFLLLRKPLKTLYAARRDAIEERVMSGERALAAAQASLAQAQYKMQELPKEVARIASEIKDETTSEVCAIDADAQAKAIRIVAIARESSAAEWRAFESLVRDELIQSALLLARELLGKENSADSDRGLRNAVVAKLPELTALN